MEKQSNGWQALSTIMTSSNAIYVLVFAFLIGIIGLILIRKGIITIHSKNIDIGIADRERDILRQQCEYISNHYKGLMATLPRGERFDEYRARYILECALDLAQEWVLFNHMSEQNSYISVKQGTMVGLIYSLTSEPIYHSKDFTDYIRKDTEEVIRTCVNIRKEYK